MAHDWAHKLVDTQRGILLHEDVDLIQELVGKLPQTRSVRVVDLGPGNGTTTLSVLCARPEKVALTSIDSDPETLHWSERVATNIDRREDCRFDLSDPADAAPQFKVGTVDLLLIDGCLSYTAAKSELEAWLSRVHPDGYVWIHDYGDPYEFGWSVAPSPGIKRAIDAMVAAGKLELVEIRGLGWAGRKPKKEKEKRT